MDHDNWEFNFSRRLKSLMLAALLFMTVVSIIKLLKYITQ